jgi:hypothetical protein
MFTQNISDAGGVDKVIEKSVVIALTEMNKLMQNLELQFNAKYNIHTGQDHTTKSIAFGGEVYQSQEP